MINNLKRGFLIKKINSLGIFKLVVDSSSNCVAIFDNDGVIFYLNNTILKLLGLDKNKLIGKKHNEVLRFVNSKNGKELNGSIQKIIASGKTKKDLDPNATLLNNNGLAIPMAVSVISLKEKNKIFGGALIFRDITEEKLVERAKTEFVSLASHQLRTPLSTVNWYAEMILNGDAGKITAEQKKYIKEIYTGNQRMIELVNDLLNISRIDLGTIVVRPELVNFKEVVESVLGELFPQIKNKQIKIKKYYDKDIPDISLDYKLVRIICQNLLSNAVKYTPQKGVVSIFIKKDKRNLLFKVSDTGIGIPKDQQSEIFGRLFRAENAKEEFTEGTGLGLYIAKLAVEKFNGNISFNSVEKKGTTFFVSIPIKGIRGVRKIKVGEKKY